MDEGRSWARAITFDLVMFLALVAGSGVVFFMVVVDWWPTVLCVVVFAGLVGGAWMLQRRGVDHPQRR